MEIKNLNRTETIQFVFCYLEKLKLVLLKTNKTKSLLLENSDQFDFLEINNPNRTVTIEFAFSDLENL